MAAVMNGYHPHNSMYNSPPSSPPGSATTTEDWKEKYYEVSDLLVDARAELDDFTRTSKELEEELERDLERNEKAQEELRLKVDKVENERDDWKSKFMSLQHTHSTTVNSLERELDATRQSLALYKAQVRELELGNDDLERNERQATSSLADVEQRYAKALEDKILLEHELQDKAVLEETCQRLRDELRDANTEITVLKDQVDQQKQLPLRPSLHEHHTSSSASLPLVSPTGSDKEDLLHTAAPDLSLEDLLPSTPLNSISARSSLQSRFSYDNFDEFGMGSSASPTPFPSTSSSKITQRTASTSTPTQATFLARALSPSSSAASVTSTRLPTPRTRRGPTTPTPQAPPSPNRIPVPSRIQKSKGVQMVSDMRARVRTLEQKLHSGLPKIRSTSTVYGGGPPTTGPKAGGGVRPPSRTASTSVQGNVRTPKKSLHAPSAPAPAPGSPWVMIADDAADITIRQSPDRAPEIPPVPTFSPMPLLGTDAFGSTPGAGRPPSRTTAANGAPRFPSTLSRPVFAALNIDDRSNPRNRTHLPPPTSFSTGASGPARPTSATGQYHRPPSRIVTFAASTAASSHTHAQPPISPMSEGRPTTPTHLPKPTTGLRRAVTQSSPSKPPTTVSRARKDSAHQSVVKANTANAGTTPGRKTRAVTSPGTPPPLPTMTVPHATAKNLVLGHSRIAAPAGLMKSRIGRPSYPPSTRGGVGEFGDEEDEEDVDDGSLRARVGVGRMRSGTTG